MTSTNLAIVNERSFFERTLIFGFKHKVISESRLESLIKEGATGIVQIANYFGTAHLRIDLENAKDRIVNLVSLYLENFAEGDLQVAAISLRDKSLLAHSKSGSDMLRRLFILPEDCFISASISGSEKDFLNDKSLASAMTLAEYRSELIGRNLNKLRVDFAKWLAKMLGLSDISSLNNEMAEPVINSAILSILMLRSKQHFPTLSELVKLVNTDRKKAAKLDLASFNALVNEAPREYQKIAQEELSRFLETYPTIIRDSGVPINTSGCNGFFFLANSHNEDDLKKYQQIAANEWYKLTKGEDDDKIFTTILLFVAVGLKPKSSMLLRDSEEVIRAFRSTGFDNESAVKFIDDYAPYEYIDDLKKLLDELESDCEIYFSNDNPELPDQHLERALKHMQSLCNVTWKGRNR